MRKSPALLFADREGRLFDHPELRAVVPVGLEHRPAPAAAFRTLPQNPPSASVASLPGRLPVGWDPKTKRVEILESVTVEGKKIRPVAVAALFPPGWTRTHLPAFRTQAMAPVLPLYGYAAAGWRDGKIVAAGLRTDDRGHWDPALYNTADLDARVSARLASDPTNTILRQVARCALEYRCFTAQNTFYRRWEGAIPMSPSCNAQCVGCISEQDPETGPPPSQWRIAAGPEVDECVRVAVPHLEGAGEGAIVSFGQGCEGEPLLRADAMGEACRAVRKKTAKGTLHVNTNGSRPDALAALKDSGLDSCRISLNAAEKDAYEAYYRPTGYGWSDVDRAAIDAKKAGLFVSLNLLVFPGVSDRPKQVDALLDFVERAKPDAIQTRNLCLDPEAYLGVLPEDRGEPIGIDALVEALAKRTRIANYNVPREEFAR